MGGGHPIKLTLFNRASQFLTDNQMVTEERANARPTCGITLAEVEGHDADVTIGTGLLGALSLRTAA